MIEHIKTIPMMNKINDSQVEMEGCIYNLAKEHLPLIVKTVNSFEVMKEALKAQHDAIDALFAMLIKTNEDFYPSSTGWIWNALLKGNEAIALIDKEE